MLPQMVCERSLRTFELLHLGRLQLSTLRLSAPATDHEIGVAFDTSAEEQAGSTTKKQAQPRLLLLHLPLLASLDLGPILPVTMMRLRRSAMMQLWSMSQCQPHLSHLRNS